MISTAENKNTAHQRRRRRRRNENTACRLGGFVRGWCLWDLGLEPWGGSCACICVLGVTAKKELAICLQRGGACLSSSALHWTALCCYSVQLLLKHSVQLLPWSFCDSASPPSSEKECLPPVVIRKVRRTSCIALTQRGAETRCEMTFFFQTEKWSFCRGLNSWLNSAEPSRSSHRVFVRALSSV